MPSMIIIQKKKAINQVRVTLKEFSTVTVLYHVIASNLCYKIVCFQ